MNQAQHEREFPGFPFESGFLDLMADNGYADNSWRNDMSPCFIKRSLCVWAKNPIEALDYGVTKIDDAGQHTDDGGLSFATLDALAKFIASL